MTSTRKNPLPQKYAEIFNRSTGGVRAPAPRLVQKAIRAWNMKKRVDALKADLDALKEDLRRELQSDDTLNIQGICKVVAQVRNVYDVTHPDALEDLLGERFDDLVRPCVKFDLEPKLKEMLADPDDAIGKIARDYVKVKTAVTLNLMANN